MAAVFAVGSTMLYAVQKIMVSSSQHHEVRTIASVDKWPFLEIAFVLSFRLW